MTNANISVNKGLEGVKSDSRRGSLIPGARSRQGSIALAGGGERRGSLRNTVAMVTDDPQHKKNLKAALAGAFDDNTISKYKCPVLLCPMQSSQGLLLGPSTSMVSC